MEITRLTKRASTEAVCLQSQIHIGAFSSSPGAPADRLHMPRPHVFVSGMDLESIASAASLPGRPSFTRPPEELALQCYRRATATACMRDGSAGRVIVKPDTGNRGRERAPCTSQRPDCGGGRGPTPREQGRQRDVALLGCQRAANGLQMAAR
jgi:hypothetical protein